MINADFLTNSGVIGIGFIILWYICGFLFERILSENLKPAAFGVSRAIVACLGCALCGWLCVESFQNCLEDKEWWASIGRERLLFSDPGSVTSAHILTGYEVWCLYLDINLPIYIFHHLLSSVVMYSGYTYGAERICMLYIFITAWSNSIFNWFYLFNEQRVMKTTFPKTFLVVGVIFASSFFFFRIICWFYITFHYVVDMVELVKSQNFDTFFYAMGVCCLSNVYVSFLQGMWMYQIFNKLQRMVTGKKKAKKN